MKKALLIVIPLILLIGAGSVFGLNYFNIIKIPFLPHKKVIAKKTNKTAVAAKATPPAVKPVVKPPAPPPEPTKTVAKPIEPKPDIEAGEKKLALVWNGLEIAALEGIIKDWKDADLARILVRMDPDKVTELLAGIEQDRASKLSRAIEAAAAKPKLEETPGV